MYNPLDRLQVFGGICPDVLGLGLISHQQVDCIPARQLALCWTPTSATGVPARQQGGGAGILAVAVQECGAT